MRATIRNDREMVNFLLIRKANVIVGDYYEDTCFHHVACIGAINIMEILLCHYQPGVKLLNRMHQTPLDLVMSGKTTTMTEYFWNSNDIDILPPMDQKSERRNLMIELLRKHDGDKKTEFEYES